MSFLGDLANPSQQQAQSPAPYVPTPSNSNSTILTDGIEKPADNNLASADKAMNLTDKEKALYQRHLTNLNGSGGVDNPDGSRSTLYQAVQEHDGKFYNIPTVWNGKREVEPYTRPDGTKMDVPNQTALDNVAKIGWDKFPSYASPDEADARYDEMHSYMEKDTAAYNAKKGKK